MYVKTLHIYAFKCFVKAALKLQYPGRKGLGVGSPNNVNVILGDNGGGKSSVLRALAIAVLAPVLLQSGFVPYRLVRRAKDASAPAEQALLKLSIVTDKRELAPLSARGRSELLARIDKRERGDLDRLHLEGTPNSPLADLLYDDTSLAFFVVGYGATRRVETGDYSESSARRSRGLRYRRVAGLFEDQVSLRPLQSWLPKLEGTKRFDEVVAKLNELLPASVSFPGDFDKLSDQYLFNFKDAVSPFSSLSDGFKSFIGWAGDLLGHLVDVCPKGRQISDVPGIVLVDEVDLHLHPEWQRSVVPTLAKTFPKIQFVFTTHSPLVVSSVKQQNVFLTDLTADGGATIRQLDEYVHGRSIEQLLLSSYFGLETTRPDAFVSTGEALFQEAAAGNSEAALSYLEHLVGSEALGSKAGTKGGD